MAIETPVEVLRRLREQARTERLSQAKESSRRVQAARPGRERGFAFGQALGEALAGGAQEAVGTQPEEDPMYNQAVQRKEWLDVDPMNVGALTKKLREAADAGDYEVSNYLTGLLFKAREMELKEAAAAATGTGKDKQWKNWDKDFRNRAGATLENLEWIKDINDPDEGGEESKVRDAILSRAESQWNALREAGIDVPRERVVKIVANDASAFFEKGRFDDTFNFDGFHASPGSVASLMPGGELTGGTAPATGPKKEGVKKGTRKGDYMFMGTEADDPNDESLWKKVGGEKKEEGRRVYIGPTDRRGRKLEPDNPKNWKVIPPAQDKETNRRGR